MKLLEIYDKVKAGQLDLKVAAKSVGPEESEHYYNRIVDLSTRPRWYFEMLDQIAESEIRNAEASEKLGVSAKTLYNRMVDWGVKRKLLAKDKIDSMVSGVKEELRNKLALDFIAQRAALKEVSEASNKDMRSVRRWVADILDTFYPGMVWRDLVNLPDHVRLRMAREVSEKLGFDPDKTHIYTAFKDKEDFKLEALKRLQSDFTKVTRRRIPDEYKIDK